MGIPLSYNIRNLTQRKGTTLMTALGIGLTVAVLVTSIALIEGLQSVFSGSGDPRQFLVLRKGTDAELTSTITTGSYQIIRQMPGIARTPAGEPMVSPEGLTVVNLKSVDSEDTGMNVTVRGLLPVGLQMRNCTIVQGSMFEPGQTQLIVGETMAKRYPDARIGNKIKFGRSLWTVVGVFRVGDSASNSEIWTDLDQLRGNFESAGGSNSLLVRANSPEDMKTLQKTIDDDQRLTAGTIGEKAYYANLTQSGAPIMVLGLAIAVIMAFGSAFAATNTMYAAVARRTREIGILRALGFGRYAILRSFMMESICLAMIGGILGLCIALPINGMTTGVGSFETFSETSFKFKVGPMAIAGGLLFAAMIGALGGFLPSWSASRKDVIQAMRDT